MSFVCVRNVPNLNSNPRDKLERLVTAFYVTKFVI
jgi:hypothetical protein